MLTLYFILVQTPEDESIFCRGVILVVDFASTPEHTDDQADNPSPSSIEVEGYRPMITFCIRSGQNWTEGDLVTNKITRLPVTERRDYITVLGRGYAKGGSRRVPMLWR